MKRFLVIIFLAFGLIFGITFHTLAYSTVKNIQLTSINYYKPPEHSREELYQDIFMTLLLPSIQSATDDYYKEFLTVSPMIAPYDVLVLSVDRPNGYRTFDFLLKLELHPYVGPHLDVGLDYITISVNPVNNVKVQKYEHIKTYELPSYYQNVIKKGLP